MSEKGPETFAAAVPDSASVMVKTLSILAGNTVILLCIPAQRKHCIYKLVIQK